MPRISYSVLDESRLKVLVQAGGAPDQGLLHAVDGPESGAGRGVGGELDRDLLGAALLQAVENLLLRLGRWFDWKKTNI